MKRFIALFVLLMVALSSNIVLAFNPDDAEGISLEELRAEFGAVPYNNESLTFGAVAKAFENEYWRTLREGYWAIQDKLQNLGYDITVIPNTL